MMNGIELNEVNKAVRYVTDRVELLSDKEYVFFVSSPEIAYEVIDQCKTILQGSTRERMRLTTKNNSLVRIIPIRCKKDLDASPYRLKGDYSRLKFNALPAIFACHIEKIVITAECLDKLLEPSFFVSYATGRAVHQNVTLI